MLLLWSRHPEGPNPDTREETLAPGENFLSCWSDVGWEQTLDLVKCDFPLPTPPETTPSVSGGQRRQEVLPCTYPKSLLC